MNCSIDNFKNTFRGLPVLNNSNQFVVTDYSERNNVIIWINKANEIVRKQGFDKSLFEITEVFGEDILTILVDNHIEYQSFVENNLRSELKNVAELNSTLDNEVMDNPVPNNFESTSLNNVNSNEYNFNQWIQTRKDLLRDLHNYKKRLVKTRGNKDKIEKTSKLIDFIKKELESYNTSSLDSLYNNISVEIQMLNELLNKAKDDPIQSANLLEVHSIKNRIETLKEITKQGNDTRETLSNNKEYEQELITKINDLENNYNNSLEELLLSILSNSELMLEHKKQAEQSGNAEQFQKLLDKIQQLLDNKNKVYSIDGGSDLISGKTFLGIESYDSVLTELIAITYNSNQIKEAGVTSIWKKKFKNAYEKITKLKINGKPINESLFEKDEFGVNTQRLINPFTGAFFQEIGKMNVFKNLFYNNTETRLNRAKAYKNWMTHLKQHSDFLQIHKIQSFVDKFNGKEDFDNYFNKYSQEERTAYEKEMREKLGDTTFEMMLEKQIENVQKFMYDYIDAEKRTYSNPLYFIEKFYSEDFLSEIETLTENNYSFDTHYLLPTYLFLLPSVNNNNFFNQDFRTLENEVNLQLGDTSTFSDFYVNAKNLIDYSVNTFKNENIDVNFNDVISLRDAVAGEILKDLSFLKRVSMQMWNLIKDLFARFYKVRFENASRDKNYNPDTDRKFNTGYNSYGHKEITEIKKLLDIKSIEELVEIGKSEGLTISDTQLVGRKRLINAIAKNRINKYVSMDLFKRIMYSTEVAQNINTRRNTQGVVSIIKDYIENIGDNAKNVKHYLNIWEAQNITKVGILDDKTSTLAKIERVRVFGKNTWLDKIFTKYNEVEKELKKTIEEEKKKVHDDFNFHHNDFHYKFNSQAETFEKITEVNGKKEVFKLSKEEIQEAYYDYLDSKLEKIGQKLRLGGIGYGLSISMFYAYLGMNYISGIKNRVAGYNQNNEAGTSGLHGFNQDDVWIARKLLRGANTMKYTQHVGVYQKHKTAQINVLKHIASELGLLENMITDLTADENDQMLISEKRVEKLNEGLTDFPLNNPEFKNQMEIFIATLMNTDITDVNGKTHKMFDKKTMSFVFNPVTMLLKDEFRTENNIANWENFTTDEEGNSPHNLLIQKFNSVKHKLHGNYNNNDKIALQSNVLGKLIATFAKWFYENLNNQYGSKKVSLTRGETDVVGRKIPFLQNKYLAGSYIVVSNISTATLLLMGAGFSLFTLGGLLTIGGGIAYHQFIIKKKIKEQKIVVKSSKNELIEAFSVYKEAGIRAIKTILSSGFVNTTEIMSEEKVKKWSYEKDHREARALLSETAQELADKINIHFYIMATITALSMIFKALKFRDDDDEEELEHNIAQLGMMINKTMNVRNELLSEVEMWGNPKKLIDMATPSVFESFVSKSLNRILFSYQEYDKGSISKEQMYYQQTWGTGNLLFGVPNVITKTFYPNDPSVSTYKDKRIYDNDRIFDFQESINNKILYTKEQREDMEYKELTTKERAKAKKIGETKLLDAGVKAWEVPVIIKDIFNISKKPADVDYKTFYEEVDWDLFEDYIDDYIRNYKEEQRNEKSPSSTSKKIID